MRKVFSIIILVTGATLTLWGGISWYQNGMPVTELIPYKNTFGTNPIHLSYLGVLVVAYGLYELWAKSSSEK